MTGRLVDARSTLEDLLKQLADKQDTLRYCSYVNLFSMKVIYDLFDLPVNMISFNSGGYFHFFQSTTN